MTKDRLDQFDLLEKSGVFINFSAEHYVDGSNLCFSIVFLRRGKRIRTGWFNDNHEFGGVVSTMESAIRLAKWYLEEPSRIDLIDSGYHDPAYKLYSEERSEFIRKLINKTMTNSESSL